MDSSLHLRQKLTFRAHGKFEAVILNTKTVRTRISPVDLISFPFDSAERFIDPHGCIRLTSADLYWRRYPSK